MKRKEIKQERFCYMLNTVLNRCEKNQWEKIGLTTSGLKVRYIDEIVNALNKQAIQKKMMIHVEKIKPINYFADGVEQARKCDAIIFVEKYADSYYKDMQRCVKLVEKEDIRIAGVVACR